MCNPWKYKPFNQALCQPISRCVFSCLVAMHSVASAAPLALTQAPAVQTGKPPAPNVIVSIDDSDSMLYRLDAQALANVRQEETAQTRMALLRAALTQAFSEHNIPDGAIRLAWLAMNRCDSIPSSTGGCNGRNGLNILNSSHRKAFLDWVAGLSVGGDRLRAAGDSPAHKMLFNAGQYLQSQPQAWWNEPSNSDSDALACRRAYNIFLSDGSWNAYEALPPSGRIGNYSNPRQAFRLPDGVVYDIGNRQVQIYRDRARFAAGYTPADAWNWPTLSDLAFYFWATDLSGLGKAVVPLIREPVARAIAGQSWRIEPYWNPANNVATWQHMSIYAVGLGAGANWAALGIKPVFGTSTWSGESYEALLAGQERWLDPFSSSEVFRMPELWHMAINSRGQYTAVSRAEELAPVLQDIVRDILREAPLLSASHTLSAATTRVASLMFGAVYQPSNWSGYLQAQSIRAGDAAIETDNPPWGGKNTAQIMAEQGAFWYRTRRVLSASSNGTAMDWLWPQLDAAQQALLNSQDQRGEQRLQYLRGDQSQELGQVGGVFRTRQSIHGDIVNSKIWYMPGNHYRMATQNPGRPNVVYVGANEGFLHAFDAANGKELLAYLPKGLISRLPALTQAGYASQHRYFVDGSPFAGDVFTQAKNLDGTAYTGSPKTYLAGFLGAGARGYFVLDVTAPQNFGNASAKDLLVLDRTLEAAEQFNKSDVNAFIGHIMAEPVTDQVDVRLTQQLVRMNDGRWALVMGNGYNSQNEQAALLIQFLEGDKALLAIPASASEPLGNSNGLAAPRLLDLNKNGAIDVAYAGDLLGNLWKFDLSSSQPAEWRAAFAGTPLFQATPRNGLAGPRGYAITTSPAFALHPDGGILLMFGTGRLLTESDRSSQGPEYVVALHDQARYSQAPPLTGMAANRLGAIQLNDDVKNRLSWQDLVEQTTIVQGDSWSLSGEPVDYASKKGWFFQLPIPGSRIIENSSWTIAEQFRIPIVLPAQAAGPDGAETCEPVSAASRYYLANVSIRTGVSPLPPPLCDANGQQCQAWRQNPFLMPDWREFRTPPFKDSDGFERYPGQLQASPLFHIQPLRPSWRSIP